MNYTITAETSSDFDGITEVTAKAFGRPNEAELISELRQIPGFVTQLSLVALLDNKIIGHILFYPVKIAGDKLFETLSLAPISVLPEYQRKGIGSALITAGINLASQMGFKSIIVVGYPDYYTKFGFQPARSFGIKIPFDAPDDVFLALELQKDALKNINGIVQYPQPFYKAV